VVFCDTPLVVDSVAAFLPVLVEGGVFAVAAPRICAATFDAVVFVEAAAGVSAD
jgi:hypothetical protein